MEIKLEVLIKETNTIINFNNKQGTISISNPENNKIVFDQPSLYLLLKDKEVVYIGKADKNATHKDVEFDQVIMITPPWEIELDYLERFFIDEALKNGIKLVNTTRQELKIPVNQENIIAGYMEEVLLVLKHFGYNLQSKLEIKETKAKPAKVQHRWGKGVSKTSFLLIPEKVKRRLFGRREMKCLLKQAQK